METKPLKFELVLDKSNQPQLFKRIENQTGPIEFEPIVVTAKAYAWIKSIAQCDCDKAPHEVYTFVPLASLYEVTNDEIVAKYTRDLNFMFHEGEK